jgi:hypothetical protein
LLWCGRERGWRNREQISLSKIWSSVSLEFLLLVPWILVSEFRDMLAVECVWVEWGIIMRWEGLCSLFLFLVLVLVLVWFFGEELVVDPLGGGGDEREFVPLD